MFTKAYEKWKAAEEAEMNIYRQKYSTSADIARAEAEADAAYEEAADALYSPEE